MEPVAVTFPVTLPYLGISLNSRVHWAQRKQRATVVRSLTGKWARMGLDGWGALTPCKVHYDVMWGKGMRSHDVDNLIGMLKPVTDGLVDAGALYEDGPKWLTSVSVEQSRWKGAMVIVTVTVTPS